MTRLWALAEEASVKMDKRNNITYCSTKHTVPSVLTEKQILPVSVDMYVHPRLPAQFTILLVRVPW